MAREMIQEIDDLKNKINRLFLMIKRRLEDDPNAARLKQINGVGPITAVGFQALLPPMENFPNGRSVSSYLGLTPREMSTGGKQRIGRITKAGPKEIRSLLVLGATSVLKQEVRRGLKKGSWLERMMREKPSKVVAVALAGKMARTAWAMTVKQEDYRDPVAAA